MAEEVWAVEWPAVEEGATVAVAGLLAGEVGDHRIAGKPEAPLELARVNWQAPVKRDFKVKLTYDIFYFRFYL